MQKFLRVLFFAFPLVVLADSRDLISHAQAQEVYTIESVPNPKATPSWNYVSNPDQVLSQPAVEQINSSLKLLEDSTTVQVAVVVVNSIGNDDPHDFGVELFNYWGIGQKNKDNGLLILLVMDQRAIEFITGKGTEGVLTDVACKHIQVDYMIPYARENNFDQCVIAGVDQVMKVFFEPDSVSYLYEEPGAASNSSNPSDLRFIIFACVALVFYLFFLPASAKNNFRSKSPEYVREQSRFYYYSKLILLNVGLPLVFLIYQFIDKPFPVWQNILFFYGWIVLLLFERRIRLNTLIQKNQKEGADSALTLYNSLNKSHTNWIGAVIFAPLPFIFYHLWVKGRLRSLRNQPRNCDNCGSLMIKSNELDDDQFLKPAEQLEEKIKSVDYDVWKCPQCSALKKYEFPALYSKYKDCPKCQTKSFYSKSKRTVVSPTYSSSGEGLELLECLHCHFSQGKKYSIAKLTRSSSSSSGSSFSSSSSSGGSSFGGGSSGGGGAGSRW